MQKEERSSILLGDALNPALPPRARTEVEESTFLSPARHCALLDVKLASDSSFLWTDLFIDREVRTIAENLFLSPTHSRYIIAFSLQPVTSFFDISNLLLRTVVRNACFKAFPKLCL